MRVRLLCLTALLGGSLLPPYIPKAALAPPEAPFSSQQFLLVEDGFLMKSSTVTGQGARRAYAEGIIYTVEAGESLEKIADRYGVSVQTVQWANKLDSGSPIRPGDELLILPVDGVLHPVARGQTLLGIAEIYGIPVEDIARQNNLEGGFILAGQELIIPGGKPIVSPPKQVATAEPQLPSTTGEAPAKPVPAKPTPTTKATPDEVAFSPTPTIGVLQKPCSDACFITQYYHGGHYALDMQERGGGPIFAAEAGTVIRAENDGGWHGGYGNVVEIDHGNGLITVYGHNKEVFVQVGDSVARGQNIAAMGNTGLTYGKTGIHVHFEVQLKGVKKNPLLYLQ